MTCSRAGGHFPASWPTRLEWMRHAENRRYHKLRPKRINDLQKCELAKIRITGADPPNAMLAHENCRMRIMQQITGEMR
jgi:hypothetical protein